MLCQWVSVSNTGCKQTSLQLSVCNVGTSLDIMTSKPTWLRHCNAYNCTSCVRVEGPTVLGGRGGSVLLKVVLGLSVLVAVHPQELGSHGQAENDTMTPLNIVFFIIFLMTSYWLKPNIF